MIIYSAILVIVLFIIIYFFYKKHRKDDLYSEIDKRYNDLLKMSVETPELRIPEKIEDIFKNKREKLTSKYNSYAYLCMNLLETIYDKYINFRGNLVIPDTWIPIIMEETRLHKKWFKKNRRLFKENFREFILNDIYDLEIIEGSKENLEELYKNFERNFPQEQSKEKEYLFSLLSKKNYNILLAYNKTLNMIVGYALLYRIEKYNALWLDYIAIKDVFQGSGFGSLFFNKIINFEDDKKVGMFLEVEIPENNDIKSKRRINFYEKLGCKRININYFMPSETGGSPMYLYFKPISKKNISKQMIKKVIINTFNSINEDVSNRNESLKKIDYFIDRNTFNE